MDEIALKYKLLTTAWESSPSFAENMAMETGLLGFNGATEIDLNTYFPQMVLMIENEVADMGIRVVDTVNLVSDLEAITQLLLVRQLFDQAILETRLSESEELRSVFQNELTGLETTQDIEILFSTLVKEIQSTLALSERWSTLSSHRYLFVSTMVFVDYIRNILDKPPRVTEQDTTQLSRYVAGVVKHKSYMQRVLQTLCGSSTSKVSYTTLNMECYGNEIRKIPAQDVAVYLFSTEPHPFFTDVQDTDFMLWFRSETDTFIEYYTAHQITEPRIDQLFKIAAEYSIPEWSLTECVRRVSGVFSEACQEELLRLIQYCRQV